MDFTITTEQGFLDISFDTDNKKKAIVINSILQHKRVIDPDSQPIFQRGGSLDEVLLDGQVNFGSLIWFYIKTNDQYRDQKIRSEINNNLQDLVANNIIDSFNIIDLFIRDRFFSLTFSYIVNGDQQEAITIST